MLLGNFTLLYVEDDLDTRELLVEALEFRVKKLYVASNGLEGLEFYKKYNPDIVLSDVIMPKMNGLDMSLEIKKIDRNQPIVILTAFNEIKYLKQAIDIGIDKFVTKPLPNLKTLIDTLDSQAQILQSEIDKKEMEHMLYNQSRLAAVGEMVVNIAHHWRQPLSMMNTHANKLQLKMVMEENISNADISKFIYSVSNQTEHLSKTIDDFRNYFHDDLKSKKKFNIKETMQKTINITQDSFKNDSIDVISNIGDCYINQNENLLSQVFLNIFNNAKDAFASNETTGKKYFFIECSKKEDSVEITFKDSAGGIKDDILDKIFQPYFTTKHKLSGTGIGLYLCSQNITKQFKGTIKASNKLFEYDGEQFNGAEFFITIPL